MMYFIHYIKTYASANRKGRELNEFIATFQDMLIYDDLSLDALKQEIQSKIGVLNAQYPNVKKLLFYSNKESWYATPEGSTDAYVFYISLSKVRHTYRFSEPSGRSQKTVSQSSINEK